jgi:lipoate-protein ligase A
VDIQINVYRINNLEDAGKVGLQFMSLHIIRRLVGGGGSVIMAMKSFMYSVSSHSPTGTDLKYRNVALIN